MWLAASALLAGLAAAEEAPGIRLSGPPRLHAGRTATRRILAPALDPDAPVTWRLVVFGAPVAEGEGTAGAVAIAVPETVRDVPAELVLATARARARVLVRIYRSRREELAAALDGVRPGVVGPDGPLTEFLDDLGIPFDRLDSPGVVRRFPGAVLLVAPGEWNVEPLRAAIRDRVRRGAFALAFGPRGDTWGAAGLLASPVLSEEIVGRGEIVAVHLPWLERREEDPLSAVGLLEVVRRLVHAAGRER